MNKAKEDVQQKAKSLLNSTLALTNCNIIVCSTVCRTNEISVHTSYCAITNDTFRMHFYMYGMKHFLMA